MSGHWMVTDLSRQQSPTEALGDYWEPDFGPFPDEAAARAFVAQTSHPESYWAHPARRGAAA